jgi:hypothetical protein
MKSTIKFLVPARAAAAKPTNPPRADLTYRKSSATWDEPTTSSFIEENGPPSGLGPPGQNHRDGSQPRFITLESPFPLTFRGTDPADPYLRVRNIMLAATNNRQRVTLKPDFS